MATTKKTVKKTAASKSAKKVAPKKATKKTTKKASPKKATPKKETRSKNPLGIRNPQAAILRQLKSGREFSRKQIVEKTGLDTASMTEWIGCNDTEKRKVNDQKHFPSLLSLGLVKGSMQDIDGRNVAVYAVTAKGKQIASKL